MRPSSSVSAQLATRAIGGSGRFTWRTALITRSLLLGRARDARKGGEQSIGREQRGGERSRWRSESEQVKQRFASIAKDEVGCDDISDRDMARLCVAGVHCGLLCGVDRAAVEISLIEVSRSASRAAVAAAAAAGVAWQ